MKRNLMLVAVTMLLAATSCTASGNGANEKTVTSSVKEQLEKAKAERKTVFMIVTDSATNASRLDSIVGSVITEKSNVTAVTMNMDEKANAELVKEYRLNGAPTPLVLVMSDRGLLMGGMLENQVSRESLEEAIPPPKFSDISYALSKGTPVIALVSNSKFESDAKAENICKSAKDSMSGKVEVIRIDTEDSAESKLITMLNIKGKLKDSYIVAINAQGIMSGRFENVPDVGELVEAAQKIVQTGCAPGGCGPTCN